MGSVYAEISAALVALYTGSTPVWRDQGFVDTISGAPIGGGLLSMPAITNGVPSAIDFSAGAGWTQFGGVTNTPGYAISPDAPVVDATQLLSAGAGSHAVYYLTSGLRTISAWYRYDTAPTFEGQFITGPSTSVGLPPPSPFTQAWQRGRFENTNINTLFGLTAAGHVVSGAGATIYWGAQAITGAPGIYYDLPLVIGTAGPATYQVGAPDLARVIYNGRLDFELDFSSIIVLWANLPDFDFWSADTPDGIASLSWDSSAKSIVLTVRGSVALTMISTHVSTVDYDQHASVRAVYDPVTGVSMIRQTVNGCVSYVIGSASGSPLASCTSMWLGSHLGASSVMPALLLGYAARTHVEAILPTIIMLGDSLPGSSSNESTIGSRLLPLSQWGLPATVVSLAVGGAKCADQLATWLASPYRFSTTITHIGIQCATNDVGTGSDASTALEALAVLVAQVRADQPTAQIVLGNIAPLAAFASVITAVNADLALGGGSVVQGQSSVLDLYALVNDPGNPGHILAIYAYPGDAVHVNRAGKVVWGNAYRAAFGL